jgi:hypothetical protein
MTPDTIVEETAVSSPQNLKNFILSLPGYSHRQTRYPIAQLVTNDIQPHMIKIIQNQLIQVDKNNQWRNIKEASMMDR